LGGSDAVRLHDLDAIVARIAEAADELDAGREPVLVSSVADRLRATADALREMAAASPAAERPPGGDLRVERILDSITDAFYLLDRGWRITYLNREAEQLLRRPRQRLVGRLLWDAYPDLVGTVVQTEYERALREHVPVSFEIPYAPLDGWFEVRAFPGPDGLSVFFREISERKRAERLRRLHDLTFETINDAVIVTEPDGTILAWNPAAERIFGYSSEEALGRSTAFLNPRVERDPYFRSSLSQAIRDRGSWSAELRFRRRDGTEGVCATTISPITDETGRLVAHLGVNRDVTERRAAERALRASEARYRTLFESIDEGFCIIQMLFDDGGRPTDYRFLETNPAWEQHTGLTDILGRTAREVLPELEEHWFEIYGRVATTGEAVRFEQGSTVMGRWFDVFAFRVEEPEFDKVALLFTDITERKRAEEEALALSRMVEESRAEIYAVDARSLRFARANRGARENLGYSMAELRALQPVEVAPEITEEAFARLTAPLVRGEREIVQFETIHRRKDGTLYPVDVHLQLFEGGRAPLFVALVLDVTERKRAEERERELIREKTAREAAEVAERRERLLAEAGQVLELSVDEAERVDAVARLLVPELADWCLVDIVGEAGGLENAAVVAAEARHEELIRAARARYPLDVAGTHPVREVARSGRAVLLSEIEAEALVRAAVDAEHLAILQELAPASVMIVPLAAGDEKLGSVTLGSSDARRRFDAGDLALAEDIGHRVSLALHNARLYRAAEEERARVARLQQVTAALLEASTVQEVADVTVRQGMEASGATAGWVALLREESGALEIVRAEGLPDSIRDQWEGAAPDAPGPASVVARPGEPLFVETETELAATFPEFLAGAPPLLAGSAAVIPIQVQRRAIGAVVFGYAGWRRFPAGERELLYAVARQASLALERALLFERERQAVRGRDEVLGVVAHDLRNPLGAINLFAHLLETSLAADDPAREYGRTILALSEQADRLIQDLLDVNRIEEGRLRFDPVPVSADRLVYPAIRMLQPTAAEKEIGLGVEGVVDSALAMADPDRVGQVLSNLIGNAVKFTPPGGCIRVAAEPRGEEVLFSVSDTGPGIPAEHLPHLFDRFWQARNARRGGAGLGLAIARGIVEGHGGRIWVRSEPGAGSTFYFTLPSASPEAAPPPDAAPLPPLLGRAPVARPAGPIRVLLVDDHPFVLRGLERTLRGHAGIEIVAEAASGEEALARAEAADPDVVVMDLSMHGIGGLEAIRRLVAARPDSRVLALTSETEEESLLPVLAAGGRGFVHKAHAHDTLADAIETVARDEVYLYPRTARLLLRGYREAERRTTENLERLTPHERDMIRLLAEGYNAREIGKKLRLARSTVDTYRTQLMQKLGLGHRSDLVRFALRSGLLSPD
jgi:PAS domain S-box-containing protein